MDNLEPIFVGIDAGKLKFNVNSEYLGDKEYPNTSKGIKDFYEEHELGEHHWVGCDNVGHYDENLCEFLYKKKIRVTRFNGIQSRRFAEMNLGFSKTDKLDAIHHRMYMEYQYAVPKYRSKLRLFEPNPEHVRNARKVMSTLEQYLKMQYMIGNMHSAMTSSNFPFTVKKMLKSDFNLFNKKIGKLKEQLLLIAKGYYLHEFNLVKTVTGVGEHTASCIVIYFDGFKMFFSVDQVAAYVGINSMEFKSGSTIYGKPVLSKRGNSYMRYLLYNCSNSAILHNQVARNKYQSVFRRNNNHMKAKVAAMKTLLKQSYGVVKKNVPFDNNHRYRRNFLN